MSMVSALFRALRDRLRRRRAEAGVKGPFSSAVAPTAETPEEATDPGYELRVERMMRVFHVDRRDMEEDYAKILLDAEVTCMRCRAKRRCLRELQAGTAVANAEHFCPNADVMFMFANEQGRTAA